MKKRNTLNILNGQMMYDYFKKHHFFNENGVYIPFNEAMCIGRVAADIFSSEFNRWRCKAHQVTTEEYKNITLNPLERLFTEEFSKIILWFDDDMFCQINLLTLLAYLDQIKYKKNVIFNLVNQQYNLINTFILKVEGYSEIYNQVILDRILPENIDLPILEKGIKLYLEYLKDNNEIIEYIRKNKEMEIDTLVNRLIKEFPEYGLGDTQYLQLIERAKSN